MEKKVHRLNKKGPSHDDDGVQHITASPYILHSAVGKLVTCQLKFYHHTLLISFLYSQTANNHAVTVRFHFCLSNDFIQKVNETSLLEMEMSNIVQP